MGEYKTRSSQPTAGPSKDDRQDEAAAQTAVESRILKHDVVGERTRITIARGRLHGIRVGMEGYVKSAGGMLADFQLDDVRDGVCFAFVDVTPDQLRSHLYVVLNPASMPRSTITRDVTTRVIHVSAEGSRSKIIIPRGSTHGVTRGMRGVLSSIDGHKGNEFVIESVTAIQAFAYVADKVDHVNRHPNVTLHPNGWGK